MNEVFPGVPQADSIDGDKLLQKVQQWWATYVSTGTESDLDLLTLFTVHTHLIMESYTTPRLLIDSPVPGSGKTTVLEHLDHLGFNPCQVATLSSPALITRMLDAGQRTILIDEADRSLDPNKEGVGELLAVLNSGYKRGATRPVLVPGKGGQWEAKDMPTYAAVVMAGNSPNLPEDTRSRTIRVLLLPDADGTIAESDWEMIEQDAEELRDEIGDWVEQVREEVRIERPPLPEAIKGRFREKWTPLKRVAAAAGGDWPELVDQMALRDLAEAELDREDGLINQKPGVLLLHHIYEVWPEEVSFVASIDLTDRLIREHPQVWSVDSPFGKDLTPKRLASMLVKSYGIHSIQPVKTGPRGYSRQMFTLSWRRMGVTPPEQSDAPDASDASDPKPAQESDASDVSDVIPDEGDADRPPYNTCQSCGRQVIAPHSRQRGICESCYVHGPQEGTAA
jgi:hypothetical protein